MTETTNYRPLTAPSQWPIVAVCLLCGALLVAIVLVVHHARSDGAESITELSVSARGAETPTPPAPPATPSLPALNARSPAEDPNVIHGARPGSAEPMVPASTITLYKDRIRSAEKRSQSLERAVATLERRNQELSAQLEGERRSKLPAAPPPAEAVLETLRPVLNQPLE